MLIDAHLKLMQSLAAHMKLLLDTPEHLWRLIEKKRYLHAAWLFLLARVIHRALVRENADDEDENWKIHGVDVMVSPIGSFSHCFAYRFPRNNFPLCSDNGRSLHNSVRKSRTRRPYLSVTRILL